MSPRKISSRDLNVLFSNAKTTLNDTSSRGLEINENIARVWLLTVSAWLGVKGEYEFPFQQFPEPDDEL